MAISKTDMHKEYERYAVLLFEYGGCDARSGISRHPAQNGGRMDETGGCHWAPFKTPTNANAVMETLQSAASSFFASICSWRLPTS